MLRAHALLFLARKELRLTMQTSLAAFLGVSPRTIQRHEWCGGIPDARHNYEKLLAALVPVNPDLARELAKELRLPFPATREHAVQVIAELATALDRTPQQVLDAGARVAKRVRELDVDLPSLWRAIEAELPKS